MIVLLYYPVDGTIWIVGLCLVIATIIAGTVYCILSAMLVHYIDSRFSPSTYTTAGEMNHQGETTFKLSKNNSSPKQKMERLAQNSDEIWKNITNPYKQSVVLEYSKRSSSSLSYKNNKNERERKNEEKSIPTQQCSICLETIACVHTNKPKNKSFIVLQCYHFFHYECLSEWISGNNSSCPHCRGPCE
jgi:hypothetical protein